MIVLVDDGSTDRTSLIARRTQASSIPLHIIRLPDTGYDIRRVPANINRAYAYAENLGVNFDFTLISNDDCIYSDTYGEELLTRMKRNRKLAITSGDWQDRLRIGPPQGTGRFVREAFWTSIGRRYPRAYGWESWILFRAVQNGLDVQKFAEVRFTHLRPLGHSHKFKHWGIEMRTLGYHPLYAVLRCFRNIVAASEPISTRGNLLILLYYFVPCLYRNDQFFRYFDRDFRKFVRGQQLNLILMRFKPTTRPLIFGIARLLELLYPIN
jgi:glycosyltransferase involved in cell wall biosynthesis